MPNTIAENLERLISAKNAIADAITEKGVSVSEEAGLTSFPSLIGQIETGSSSKPPNDVIFIDYDGTIVQSYSAAEFANLSSLPENPSHDGLTAQGWNYTLADAKTHVSKYGELIIGQTYTTSDGKTRIYISLPENAVSPYLQLYLNANTTAVIDWGDDTTSTWNAETADFKNEQHVYSALGDYIIGIDVTSGSIEIKSAVSSHSMLLSDNDSNKLSVYQMSVKKIEIGDNVTSIGANAFQYCYALQSVVIPSGVTSIGANAFQYCRSLQSVVIPSGVTSIGANAFQSCTTLQSVVIPSGVTSIDTNAFQSCTALQSVVIPSGVTSIDTNTFQNCYALQSVVIPSGVTSIGANAFQSCYALVLIKFERQTPPTLNSSNVFAGLKTYAKILVPSGSLADYTSAANYPDPNTYTYEEY